MAELVVAKAASGDPDAASGRGEVLGHPRILAVDAAAIALAAELVRAGSIPEVVAADAMHVAIAAVNHLDFLLTWNCAHINNAARKTMIESVCA